MNDIVERLRAAWKNRWGDGQPMPLLIEAADEIERQAEKVFYASIERSKLETALKVANDLLRETRESLARVTAQSCTELSDAQAEIERLRGDIAEDVHSNLKLQDEIERPHDALVSTLTAGLGIVIGLFVGYGMAVGWFQ